MLDMESKERGGRPDLHAMELNRVSLGEAHDGRLGDVHPRRRPRANVFHQLLDVLGCDGGGCLEFEDDAVVHLHIEAPDEDGHAARHGEDLHLRQAWNPAVVELGGEHSLVEPLRRPGLVPLDDVRARPLDDMHERGSVVTGGERGLNNSGPGHGEDDDDHSRNPAHSPMAMRWARIWTELG